MPADLTPPNLEKTVTAKPGVITWLKRSMAAVKTARANLQPTAGTVSRLCADEWSDAALVDFHYSKLIHAPEAIQRFEASYQARSTL